MKLTIDQIQNAVSGRVLQRHQETFEAFGIDSRKIPANGLFFAMKGENTDGHQFIEDAFRNGAGGAVVGSDFAPTSKLAEKTLIQVEDTMIALQTLAQWARLNSPMKYVGITGSSGKTSTKEFTATLLSKRWSVFKSEGNLNSTTGLPLSLLSMDVPPASRRHSACAVFEVAMNKPGEIARLSDILRPDIGVILNVNPVHASQFESIEGIADEKASLVHGMKPDGMVVYNADDPMLLERLQYRTTQFTYGFSPRVNLRITDTRMRGVRGSHAVLRGSKVPIPVETRLCGIGNLYNIAAATSVALQMDLPSSDIEAAIAGLKPYQQRGILIETNGIHIYDDTYNSNPRALEMVLKMASESSGYKRKIAVLGDMLELGAEEELFHKNAGEQVAGLNFQMLITAGPLSKLTGDAAAYKGVNVIRTSNSTEAAEEAAALAKAGDLFVVKGSRGMKMEVVVERLQH